MNASKHAIQYPPQTGPYKVFVKDKGLWQKHRTARLQISVGNPKHDGEKFFALTEWAEPRFDRVILIISDTLQRHNLSFYRNLGEKEAYALSLKMGDYWLEKNKVAINNLSTKVITRWNDWLEDAAYQEAHIIIQTEYERNERLRMAVDEKALEFSSRQFGLSDPSAIQVSIKYILEELAAFSLMFANEKAIDVYPGSWFMDILEILATSEISMAEVFKKAECLRVDFVRNKSNIRAMGSFRQIPNSTSI